MTYNYKEKKDNYGHIYKRWTDGGKLHRVGGPALIVCYDNGSVKFEKYYINGIQHRKDGPALIDYTFSIEEYIIYNKRLGFGRDGFWALWETLDESERRNPLLLKTLIQYL